MWSGVAVLREPVIDDDLCQLGRREPLGSKDLPMQRPIEPLVVSIFPRRSGIDTDRRDAHFSKPVLHRVDCELRSLLHREEALLRGYGHVPSLESAQLVALTWCQVSTVVLHMPHR